MPFLFIRRDHLWSTSGIICDSGSVAVQFGDHFLSGDHLRRCTSDKQIRNGKIVSVAQSMESKSVKNSNIFLFGLSFNLILALGLLGFTCYSLRRLESRVMAVEQDLLVLNHPHRRDNHGIIKPTSTRFPLSDAEMKVDRGNLVKRAIDGSSKCRECNSICLNSTGSRKVRGIVYSFKTF